MALALPVPVCCLVALGAAGTFLMLSVCDSVFWSVLLAGGSALSLLREGDAYLTQRQVGGD